MGDDEVMSEQEMAECGERVQAYMMAFYNEDFEGIDLMMVNLTRQEILDMLFLMTEIALDDGSLDDEGEA